MEATNKAKPLHLGEVAVEGLFSGLIAGLAMALVIFVIEVGMGVSPQTVLGYFDPNGGDAPLQGLLIHFAVAGVYGVGFGLLLGLLGAFKQSPGMLGTVVLGCAFGLAVLAIAEWIVFPHSNAGLQLVPFWGLALAHLVYGAVLGGMMGRTRA